MNQRYLDILADKLELPEGPLGVTLALQVSQRNLEKSIGQTLADVTAGCRYQ